jgi:demethylmenaquinone methyltransferase / 2-methoxy-6-polyprenyl-1,4-benzoquinol methylase
MISNHQKAKATAVKKIFSEIVPRYDLINHLLSANRDSGWRKFALRRIPAGAKRVLDLATGTGDMAVGATLLHPEIEITGLDFVHQMIEEAKIKKSRKAPDSTLHFVNGDAMSLPFPDCSFDTAMIAFGLRNIPDRLSAIREMARVVKSSGKILILEMTLPKTGLSSKFFNFYVGKIVPYIGGIVSGNRGAYRYLSSSIDQFLKPEELTELCTNAGLKEITAHPLTFGIAYLHEGTVP